MVLINYNSFSIINNFKCCLHKTIIFIPTMFDMIEYLYLLLIFHPVALSCSSYWKLVCSLILARIISCSIYFTWFSLYIDSDIFISFIWVEVLVLLHFHYYIYMLILFPFFASSVFIISMSSMFMLLASIRLLAFPINYYMHHFNNLHYYILITLS